MPFITLVCRSTKIANVTASNHSIFPTRNSKLKETEMKLIIPILLLVFLIFETNFAHSQPKGTTHLKQNTIESLLNGLNSENIGLKSSCAYMIGELQISKAIIPLMKLLRTSENEDLRITAALALYKIGTPMSINAVKQAIKFDESKRVSKHCADFYNDFSKNKITDEEISMVAAKTALK